MILYVTTTTVQYPILLLLSKNCLSIKYTVYLSSYWAEDVEATGNNEKNFTSWMMGNMGFSMRKSVG